MQHGSSGLDSGAGVGDGAHSRVSSPLVPLRPYLVEGYTADGLLVRGMCTFIFACVCGFIMHAFLSKYRILHVLNQLNCMGIGWCTSEPKEKNDLEVFSPVAFQGLTSDRVVLPPTVLVKRHQPDIRLFSTDGDAKRVRVLPRTKMAILDEVRLSLPFSLSISLFLSSSLSLSACMRLRAA